MTMEKHGVVDGEGDVPASDKTKTKEAAEKRSSGDDTPSKLADAVADQLKKKEQTN